MDYRFMLPLAIEGLTFVKF